MNEKNPRSVSNDKVKGDVSNKKTMATTKKNGSCRKVKRGKSKKTVESSNKVASTSQTDTHTVCDQTVKESKIKNASTKQSKQPVVREKQKIKTKTNVNGAPVKREELKLRPSEIRYSQCSISNQFTDGADIGQLLDDIYFGRCFASAIPQIEVSKMNGKWVSADNRRLWVFKQLEVLGKIEFITVKVSKKIYSGKLTSGNGGKNIEIRGADPSGILFPLISGKTENTQKTKRRRRRGRRNAGKSKQSEQQNVNSTHSEGTSPTTTGINVCQDTAFDDVGTVRHQQERSGDVVCSEEFIFYDSDEWTDDDVPGTYPNAGNDTFSHSLWDNNWNECETLFKRYEIEKVFDEYSETNSSSESNDPVYLDYAMGFDDLGNQRYNDHSRKDFEHPKEEIIPFYKSLYKDSSAQAEVDMSFDGRVPHQWNEWDDDDDDDDDPETPYGNYKQDYYTDICGRRDCSRCYRMAFYRDMDKGYYYEPPCQHVTAGYRSPQPSDTRRNTEVKKHSENSSVLSDISRGLEKVIGFFNELFR